MITAGRAATKPVEQRFEDLSSSYRFECAHGIPMSVRQRYELRLSRLREELRNQQTSCRLGDVLKRIGAVDEERLANALRIQRANGTEKLLGEVLIDLGWVDEETIRRAVKEQAATQRIVTETGMQSSCEQALTTSRSD